MPLDASGPTGHAACLLQHAQCPPRQRRSRRHDVGIPGSPSEVQQPAIYLSATQLPAKHAGTA
eukprot:10719647-Lingulodinium_polyedra.AAC.1